MGAWGTRPYDNDTAADWFGNVLQPVSDSIEELLNRPVDESHYDEYRAAAWLLIKIGRNFVYDTFRRDDHLSRLHDRLQTIRADQGWMDGWRDSEDIKGEMDEIIIQMQRACKWNNVVITF
jgi:hypothetical protein